MTAEHWNMAESDGQLLVKTGVTGRAAKLGHRLTIAMNSWRATVTWTGGAPTGVELVVVVDSLDVLRGEGGAKGLSSPEKRLARSNALGILDADRFPQILFRSDTVDEIEGGYRIAGSLQIHGTDRDHVVDLRVEDRGDVWRMSTETEVRHSDFGLKPYSMFLGSMKVVDAVTVSFVAEHAKGE
jgi:polyisoprenoid-binding protein YceI